MPQKPAKKAVPNHRLRQARLERGWSQAEVADKISDIAQEWYVHTSQVSRWESGVLRPSALHQQHLCALFGKTPAALGFLAFSAAGSSEFLLDPAIPHRARPLVGRDELLRHIKRHLYHSDGLAFAALYGLPGVGKTALAVELAHDPGVQQHFPDGVLWASLGPRPMLRELLSRWARLLGMRGAETRTWRSDEAWARAIHAAIGPRRMLLVIDDAWKIEEAQVCKLGGPFCAHLLTTRIAAVATHHGSEQAISIHELEEEDGIALLAQFAPQAVQTELQEVRTVVREVGGLPLALRLIGSYLSTHTYHKQVRRLREALRKLHHVEERLRLGQPQVGLQRHPSLPEDATISLESVIGLSHAEETLDEQTQQALQALAVFPAKPYTFSEAAALKVAATTVETLDRLVDVSLVEVSGQGRYTLHQTIADYLRVKGIKRVASERMVAYFVDFVEQHHRDFNMLELETGNILWSLETAFELGLQAPLVQGANAFADFLLARGMYEEAELHLMRARQAASSLGDRLGLATTLLKLGELVESRGDNNQAQI